MSQGSMTQVLLTLINLLTAGYHKGWKTSEFPKLPINSKQKGFGTLCTEVRIPASIFWLQQIHRIKLPPGVAQLLLLKHITAIKNKTKQQFLPATWTLQQKPLLFKQPGEVKFCNQILPCLHWRIFLQVHNPVGTRAIETMVAFVGIVFNQEQPVLLINVSTCSLVMKGSEVIELMTTI